MFWLKMYISFAGPFQTNSNRPNVANVHPNGSGKENEGRQFEFDGESACGAPGCQSREFHLLFPVLDFARMCL